MESQKSRRILPIIVSIVITAVITSGIFYFWGKTLQNQFADFSGIDKATTQKIIDSINSQVDGGEVIDKETGLKIYDYAIFNTAIGEVMPRVCLDQQKKNLNPANPICLLIDIENKGGDATETLKKYRDSL